MALLFFSAADRAFAGENPNWDIAYSWNNTPVVDGGTYDFRIGWPPSIAVFTWPGGNAYGLVYKGEFQKGATSVNGHFLGSFGSKEEFEFFPEQGKYFVIIRNFSSDQDVENHIDAWIKTGTSTDPLAVPPDSWGIVRFTVGPPPPEPDVPDPVIIIPGILGSEQHNGEWVIDPILHTYDDLIATLDVNHYTPGVDLFTFPYNWRKSNVETALLLKQKIDEVKGICQCEKVDLVAHSMGGLVARQYIQSDDYDQDVDQLIFLGTPHLGAPKAYLMWEGGTVAPPPLSIEDRVFQTILEHEGYEKRYPTLFAYLRTEPIESVRQLLSVENYVYDDDVARQYPDNYPSNSFLEALNTNISKLYDAGVEIHNFVGNREASTISKIQVQNTNQYVPLWGHGYPAGFYENEGNPGLIKGFGDETVPISSASYVSENVVTTNYEHTELPSRTGGEVFEILTGEIAETVIQEFPEIPNLRLLLIKILSPADLLVIAPDGKKIGKENGDEVNEIENGFYTGFTTDTEYITILDPLDGEYKIYTHGTDSGSYTVETNYIGNEVNIESSFTGNTVPGLVTELIQSIDNAAPHDTEITPNDLIAPAISILSPTTSVFLRSESLLLHVQAHDDSGINSLETNFDGEPVPNSGSVDLFFHKLGTHTIAATAKDNVNNYATTSREVTITANATSTRSDLLRSYTLGWMTKKIYDDLLKKFNDSFKKRTILTSVNKTITSTKGGKSTTKTVVEKVSTVEIYFDKKAVGDMLKMLEKYRGKGLNELGYQLIKEDVEWLMNH